jgi:SAM-dependent methyltransferase
MRQNKPPDPGPIMQMATGYWVSATLFAANSLNLFGLLANDALSALEVAEQTGTDTRGVTLLLDACVGIGLLLKQSAELIGQTDRYYNAPGSEAFLVPGKPGYLGGALHWSADQYEAWGELAKSVREGRPAVPPSLHLGDDPKQTRNFVMGMHHRALGVARGVIPFLEMEGVERLLDVGGGPGTYASLLARQFPGLQVDVLDLPAVVAIARELVAEAGLGDRVHLRAGDATTVDYGSEEYDGVLFSGVLHQMSTATIVSMLSRAQRALKPGGRVWISDMMLDYNKTQPVFSTLFSLQMLLTSDEGAVFSTDECLEWLEQSGFVEAAAQPLPPPLPYIVVNARKP